LGVLPAFACPNAVNSLFELLFAAISKTPQSKTAGTPGHTHQIFQVGLDGNAVMLKKWLGNYYYFNSL
jgi:hypothetical protein